MVSVPDILYNIKLTVSPAIDLEEVCNGVIHPVTKQTINKYEHLIRDETLAEMWKKAMCRELGRLAQGFDEIKGTNTVKFLTLEEIKNIPDNKKITFVRIVVNYRPHKPKELISMIIQVPSNTTILNGL